MARARRRSKLGGVNKLRRTLRRLPEAVAAPVKREMAQGAAAIGIEAESQIPVDQGDLRDAFQVKMSRDGLSARIGYHPSAPGFKRAWRRAGWRAGFIEFGTVALPGVFFLTNAWERHRRPLVAKVGRAVSRGLRKASQ